MTDQELYEILGYQPKSFAEGGFTNEQVASYIRDNKLDAAGAQQAAQSYGVSPEQLAAAQAILSSCNLSGVNAATQAYATTATPAQDVANRDFAAQQGLAVAPAFDQAAQDRLAAQFKPLFTNAAAQQTATATPAATSITNTLDNAGLVSTEPSVLPVQNATTGRMVNDQSGEGTGSVFQAYTPAEAALYNKPIPKPIGGPAGATLVPMIGSAQTTTGAGDNVEVTSGSPQLTGYSATIGNMNYYYKPDGTFLYSKVKQNLGDQARTAFNTVVLPALTAGFSTAASAGQAASTLGSTLGNFLGITDAAIANAVGNAIIGAAANKGDLVQAAKNAAIGYGVSLGADQINGALNKALQDSGMSVADAAAATKAALTAGTSIATGALTGANIPQTILNAGLGAATNWAAGQSGLTGPAKAVFTNALTAALRGKDISVPGVFMAAMNGAKSEAARSTGASTGTGESGNDTLLSSGDSLNTLSDTDLSNLLSGYTNAGSGTQLAAGDGFTLDGSGLDTVSNNDDELGWLDSGITGTFDRTSGDDTSLTDEQLAAIAAGANGNTATPVGTISVTGSDFDTTCPTGMEWDDELDGGIGGCVFKSDYIDTTAERVSTITSNFCGEGMEWDDVAGECVVKLAPVTIKGKKECGEGMEWSDEAGKCVAKLEPVTIIGTPTPCGDGTVWDDDANDGEGGCVPVKTDTVDGGCGLGFHPDPVTGLCVEDDEGPDSDECPTGKVRNLNTGECEDPDCGPGFHPDPVTGLCVEDEPEPCDEGYHYDEAAGRCVQDECPDGMVRNLNTGKCEKPDDEGCGEGFHPDPVTGLCVEDDDEGCGKGFHPDPVTGLCVEDECPEGMVRNLATGECEDPDTGDCPDGMVRNLNTGECETPTEECPPGQIKDENGKCYTPIDKPPPPKPCPEGQSRNAAGVCVPIVKPPPPKKCPPGQVKDADGNCVPIVELPSTETGGGEPGYKPGDVVKAREGAAKDESEDTLEELLAALEGREPVRKSKQKAGEKAKMATGGTVKHGCGCKKCEEKKPDTTVNDLLASLGFNEYSGGSMDDLLRTIR